MQHSLCTHYWQCPLSRPLHPLAPPTATSPCFSMLPPHMPPCLPPLPPPLHPRYCATDMSSWRGTQSAADGADTPAWLALLPAAEAEAASGKFWRDRQQQAW
jgi:hypothetical protein